MINSKKIYIKKPKPCHKCKQEIFVCPKCGYKGIEVLNETVQNLSIDKNIKENDTYHICTNRQCDVIYFSKDKTIYKNDIKVKVWYKEKIEDFMVCYCHKIMLLDIVGAVAKLNGNATKEEILKVLNRNIDEKHCEIENPVSKNCDILFNNAIEYAKRAYKINTEGDN